MALPDSALPPDERRRQMVHHLVSALSGSGRGALSRVQGNARSFGSATPLRGAAAPLLALPPGLLTAAARRPAGYDPEASNNEPPDSLPTNVHAVPVGLGAPGVGGGTGVTDSPSATLPPSPPAAVTTLPPPPPPAPPAASVSSAGFSAPIAYGPPAGTPIPAGFVGQYDPSPPAAAVAPPPAASVSAPDPYSVMMAQLNQLRYNRFLQATRLTGGY